MILKTLRAGLDGYLYLRLHQMHPIVYAGQYRGPEVQTPDLFRGGMRI